MTDGRVSAVVKQGSKARAKYRYSVAGIEHESSRWQIGDWQFYSSDHPTLQRRVCVNDVVHVRYDPRRPSRSTLWVGVSSSIYLFAAMGLLLAVGGLVILLGLAA
jgi:hypothetical protein